MFEAAKWGIGNREFIGAEDGIPGQPNLAVATDSLNIYTFI